MADVSLSAKIRSEFGKGAARRLRREEKIPAVIYGHGAEPVHVELPSYDMMMALKTPNVLINLDIEGKKHLVIPKAVQREAIRQFLVHVDLLTVHIAGGVEMLQAAVAGVGSVQTEVTTKIVGITQLTSTDRQILNEQIGIPGTVAQCVIHYARLGREAGLDGVVCSGWEAASARTSTGTRSRSSKPWGFSAASRTSGRTSSTRSAGASTAAT